MDTAIISPWVFYWIDILANMDTIAEFCFGFAVLSFIGLSFIKYFVASDEVFGNDKQLRKLATYSSSAIIVFIITGIIWIVIPSKEAMIAILVANKVTYSNAEKLKIGAKELADYVIEKSNELSKDK